MALGKVQQQIVAQLEDMERLTPEQQDVILATPGDLTGDALDRLLQDEYKVTDFQLLVAKARAHGLSPFNVQRYQISTATFERVPQDFCQQNLVLPVGEVGNYLLVALANPFEVAISTKIQEMTGKKVVRLLGRERDIRDKFNKNQQVEVQFTDVVEKIGIEFGTTEDIKEEDLANEESGPIIELANRVIEDAYFAGTSDIHIEPWEKELVVRYRIDGVCQEKLRLPIKVAGALVARLKIMSNLDIAERRLPQDGRIVFKQFTKKSIDIDLRVSTAPLNHGEGVVLRILDKQKSTLPLQMLGFTEANLVIYRKVIRQPYGMVLHCGPTGSGKSMTLYSALNEINSPETVIRTAEDPIEYTLAGINQMQMHRQIGLTFANALRSFLRQDPDIILVGEIRDRETAEIAVEAALTGHLLLSTLHTNDAPSAVARLTDMGIERFMLSASLLCVCAQRLMRRVCKNCKVPVEPVGREKELIERAIGWSGQIFKHNPKGCPRCSHTGYKGRVGIHELMVVNEELVDGINKGLEASELKKIAIRGGMMTLHQDSMVKVKEGMSTFEEALSTVPPDL
ncbi:MAG TPA: GspE/PulE family protein [Opitutaceae bacterium]|nr:GspE/PulE family protein [Opitutaceae bacterium]